MLLSAVSVLVVAQSSSEIPEGFMNNPVYRLEPVCLRDQKFLEQTSTGILEWPYHLVFGVSSTVHHNTFLYDYKYSYIVFEIYYIQF